MQGDDGTCYESLNGGNHARYWVQNGSSADTGAIFFAASVEMNAQANHMIVDNGESEATLARGGDEKRRAGKRWKPEICDGQMYPTFDSLSLPTQLFQI